MQGVTPHRALVSLLAACSIWACDPDEPTPSDHGPIAPDIAAPMGQPVPYATAEQRATFERGQRVALRRFARSDGLGPAFNVTFCGSCHERPTTGGGAGLYRNFFLGGITLADGSFTPLSTAGESGGVVRMYYYGDDEEARPAVPEEANVIAQRNPIPFFGVGLLAEIPEEAILARSDPDDEDGDGISGRPNWDRGFVGRFGRKAQTVSIEGFIRGPLFNHLGVTSNPLTEEQKARLPVDSSSSGRMSALLELADGLSTLAQASAPAVDLVDDDGVPDPELAPDDLFDLVSFAMLLAAPELEEPNEQATMGRGVFDELGCGDCHAPRLVGPRGPLPVYSDLLLHDMGPELADGLVTGEATGSEFRTQPLWGLSAVGPYLHDGRATTLEAAILWHGGEAERARDAFEALGTTDRDALIEFLMSLGGRSQYSPGLLPPMTPLAGTGEYGGPLPDLSDEDRAAFLSGRELFDREFGFADGAGQPRLNGDSCRACHFEPVLGGAGPRGVNVMRHGILNGTGEFVPPTVGTVLHKTTTLFHSVNRPQAGATIFEHRQTPHLFGLGLIEAIPDDVILANADPDDARDADGITGKPSFTDGGQLGRFGWKAQVPSLAEFVRDAVFTELGMTIEYEPGLTFGRIHDTDSVPDPEMSRGEAGMLTRYLSLLGPPPRQAAEDPAAATRGEGLFDSVGCTSCHIPELDSSMGPVPLYSDLLLHEILPADALGIEDASATMREMRTAPLWGISQTGPYLHTGEADTLDEAIGLHEGEAVSVRDAYQALTEEERSDLLSFLGTL